MKVIRKQKELVVIHMDYSPKSFIEIGNYISLNRLIMKNESEDGYSVRFPYSRLLIKCDDGKGVALNRDDYIVIDPEDTNNVQVISKEEFERDFIQIAEGGPKDDM
ncbi:MAG: hypothetical protein K6B70_05865 [Clostridia bacterium]|nr:hypothetical protein [Clostridia bacterium]